MLSPIALVSQMFPSVFTKLSVTDHEPILIAPKRKTPR